MNIKRAQIEVTSKCNYKCITCKHGYLDYGQDLSPSICEMLISDVVPNLDMLELQGTGESLMSEMTEKLVTAAAVNNTEVTLITNGSLLTEDIIRTLAAAGTQLVVSLDGSNAEVYHTHRPIGNFDTVISNIKRAVEFRNNNIDNGFSIVVNMVLTKLNRDTIMEMIDLLSGVGVDFLFVSEVRECMPDKITWSELNLLSESQSEAFKSMINECKAHAEEKKIGFAFNANEKPAGIKKTVCQAAWNHIFVSSTGDVSVCCELSRSFGNLHEQSLDEILSCAELKKFQDEMKRGNYDKRCLTCCLPWGLPN